MKLWTIMPLKVYQDTIEKNGIYFTDTTKVDSWEEGILGCEKGIPYFYSWMVQAMKDHNVPLSHELPVWAWYVYNGKHKAPKISNLYYTSLGSRVCDFLKAFFSKNYKELVRLELEIPDEYVLLHSDDEWCELIMGGVFLDKNEGSFMNTHDYYFSLTEEKKEEFVKESMAKVCCIREADYIAACFDSFTKDQIIEVKKFKIYD